MKGVSSHFSRDTSVNLDSLRAIQPVAAQMTIAVGLELDWSVRTSSKILHRYVNVELTGRQYVMPGMVFDNQLG